MNKGVSRALAVLLLAIVFAAGYYGFAAPMMAAYLNHANAVDDLEYRITKFKQELNEKPALEKRLANIAGDRSLKKYLLQGASAQLAAANLQDRLQKMIARNGGTFISAQTLDSANVGNLEEVKVGLKLEADIDALKAILHAIESDIIILLLSKVNIRAKSVRTSGKLGEMRAVGLKVALQVKGYRRDK